MGQHSSSPSCPRLGRRRLALLLAPFLAGLLAMMTLAVASEDESSDETKTITSILEPGDNFVGWVDESLPLDELLVQVPGIQRVSAWDAVDQSEVSAIVGENGSFSGALSELEPGAAYVIRLGGDAAVEWKRSVEPAKGRVQLHMGNNWIAWLGPDDWQVEDLAKGIGTSLVEIKSGDRVYDPRSPETATDWPKVMRGDALELTLARDVIWLQPTFVTPKIHYAGSVDFDVRRLVERDLAATLDYSARELGIQADPFSMVVVVASGAKSAHDKIVALGRTWAWESFKNYWRRAGGWYMSDLDAFFLKTEAWEGYRSGRYFWGRYTVLHEYVHALQYQLMGDNYINLNWLLEGSANWYDSDHATQDRNGYPLSRVLINALNQAAQGPPLWEIESSNRTWQYSFGLVAANMLIDRVGKDGVLEFYRKVSPSRTGPGGRWESHPTLRSTFEAAYGLTLDDFYKDFEALMAKRRGSAQRRPASDEVRLRGTILNSDGSPRSGVSLQAQEFKNNVPAGWVRRAQANEDGEFELFVRKRSEYRVGVQLADRWDCRYWWDASGEPAYSRSSEDGTLISVSNDDPERISITVDSDRCRWKVSGQLLGPDEKPLAGIHVSAASTSVTTELDGSFELVTKTPGSYQLYTNLGGCRLYWGKGYVTEDRDQAGDIQVADQDVGDIQFQVPADFCVRFTVAGHLVDSNGNGMKGVWVNARADSDNVRGRTDASGRFQIVLSDPGQYRLYAYVDGCRVYHREGGATGVSEDRSLITVSDRDIDDVVFRLQEDMCTLRITGTLSNADGTPRSGVYVRAQDGPLLGGDWPEDDGAFSFTVPAAGSYKLNVAIDGCRLYYGGDGVSGGSDQARALNISSSSVANVRFVLPDNPCLTIAGHILDRDGNGIANAWINAQADGDSVGRSTDADGRFEFKLSDPGDYSLSAWIDGCRVFYRPESATWVWSDRAVISVSDQDANDIVFQLQGEMCTLRIAGTLSNADGTPRTGVYVRAQDGPLLGGDWPEDDGAFSFTVPTDGSYKLNVTIDGCTVYYGGDGVSGGEPGARPIHLGSSSVANDAVTGIEFRLPEEPAAFCN